MLLRKTSLATVFYYLGIFLASFNAFWLCPRYLTSDQIGLYAGVHNMALLLAPFAQLGLSQSAIRYFPYFSPRRKPLLLGLLLVSGALGYSLFISICFTYEQSLIGYFSKKSPALIHHLPLVMLITLLITLHRLGKDWARSLHNVFLPSFIQNVLIKGLIIVSVLLYARHWFSYETMLYGLSGIYILGVLLYLIYMGMKGDLRVSFKFSTLKPGFLQEFTLYTILNTVGSSSFTLVTKLDSIMIMALLGLKSGGIYVTAICLAALIEAPRRALKQIANPILAQLLANDDQQGLRRLYQQLALHQLLVAMGLFVLVYVNLSDAFSLIPGQEYSTGQMVALLISLAKLLDTPFGIGGDLMMLSRHYWFNTIALLCLVLISILTNYFMIPWLGINGAAAATVISLFLYNSIICAFVWSRLDMQPFSPRMLWIPLLGGLVALMVTHLPVPASPLLAIGVRSLSVAAGYFCLVVVCRVSPQLNTALRARWQRQEPPPPPTQG